MSHLSTVHKAIASVLAAMVAYYLSGLFGLGLAIPPGFASAIWPASGVALAMALLLPVYWVAVGVLFGSFILNLGLSSDQFSAISLDSLYVPTIIASGSTMQLLLGYSLYNRFIGSNPMISLPRSILQFSLIVVPVSCLMASTMGAYALYINNVIQHSQIWFTWFTWWVGDAIGMLLFTPMLMVLFTPKSEISKKRKMQVVIPSSVIFIFTCLLFFWSSQERTQKIDRQIKDYGEFFTQKVHESLQLSKNKLLSYQAYFQGSHHISFNEFNRFSKTLLQNNQVLHGVGWTEIIERKNRVKKELELQKQGYPNFTFSRPNKSNEMVPVKEKSVYYPVLYIYPYERNSKALGLDLSSLPGRLDILKSVEQDGEGRATPPITLVQGNDSQKATILYLPVWQDESKQMKLVGYVSGVYLFSGIVSPVINLAEKERMIISMFDVTDDEAPVPLIESDQPRHQSYPSVFNQILFENRLYRIQVTPSEEFDLGSKDWVSWWILIIGFILAALLQAFILMMTGAIEYTSRKVTERTKELLKATHKAEQANLAKSMFLANMSHEFRTPLNAILGFINLCLKTNLNTSQKQYLNQAKLASDTLVQLINQTLDYAKIESGKLELEEAEFDLANMILKLHSIFCVQFEQKGVEFKVESQRELPTCLIGDALRMEQVMLNLLSNAYKFTEEGSVSLSINVSRIGEVQYLNISVKDTGIGISKANQAHLFESFRQADNSTTRKYGGTGLGLAITKKLIHLMEGEVQLNSEEGLGCEFLVNIPIKACSEFGYFRVEDIISNLELSEDKAIPKEQPVNVNALQGLNILLVEDIDLNRLIATEILESHGANVTCAIHGEDALAKLAETSEIDLVLMDIQMPVLDGYGATKKIREHVQFKDIPILAMTANAMKEDVEKCERAGMNGHIAKPIDEALMLKTILETLV